MAGYLIEETQMVCNLMLPPQDTLQINVEFGIQSLFEFENLTNPLTIWQLRQLYSITWLGL